MSEVSRAYLSGGPYDGTATNVRVDRARVEIEKVYIGESLERISSPGRATYVDTGVLDDQGRRVFKQEENNE